MVEGSQWAGGGAAQTDSDWRHGRARAGRASARTRPEEGLTRARGRS